MWYIIQPEVRQLNLRYQLSKNSNFKLKLLYIINLSANLTPKENDTLRCHDIRLHALKQ